LKRKKKLRHNDNLIRRREGESQKEALISISLVRYCKKRRKPLFTRNVIRRTQEKNLSKQSRVKKEKPLVDPTSEKGTPKGLTLG